jgi:DNA-binding transcriptional MocR family regulator
MLITGASGAGKSTVRRAVEPALASATVCVELRHVAAVTAPLTLAWRQQATEAAVQFALELQGERRHVLLSGDPVAAAEVVAAPSAPQLEGIAVCLLDLDAEEQAARLAARGDDPALLPHHQAFAEWMRRHADDPRQDLHVLMTGGWDAMRWERLSMPALRCRMETIDTAGRSSDQVAASVLSWCRRVLDGNAPIIHAPRDSVTDPADG